MSSSHTDTLKSSRSRTCACIIYKVVETGHSFQWFSMSKHHGRVESNSRKVCCTHNPTGNQIFIIHFFINNTLFIVLKLSTISTQLGLSVTD